MRLICPEVVQTSAMDCGPAALKCLLEGFGIPVSYGRLREACQTDVDGTSIDTLEDVAVQLGLDAEQVMLPVDHLLEPTGAALPSIIVVRLPNGFTHFVVAWRRHGSLVQLMDPASGRRWVGTAELLRDLYVHETVISAAAWREWAVSDEFLVVLASRLRRTGVDPRPLVDSARADGDWRALATLDAATRMVAALVDAGVIRRGREARRLLAQAATRARAEPSLVPAAYWSVRPTGADEDGIEQVRMRGAVLVRIKGVRAASREQLSPDLRAALDAEPARPARALFAALRDDGLLRPAVLACGVAIAAAGSVAEALWFRGLLDGGRHLGLLQQRLSTIVALVVFLAAMLLIELSLQLGAAGLGRRLEVRLRILFLSKIPRLADRYFASRPTSDMAERVHVAHTLRTLPRLAVELLSSSTQLVITTAALAWLDPRHAAVAVAAAVVGVTMPLVLMPPIIERDMRVRVHEGALMRFYLDALVGLITIRAHGAERAMRREHEALLVNWAGASRGLVRAAVAVEAVQVVTGFALAAWLLVSYLGGGSEGGAALLLIYWALNVPVLGQEIAVAARRYPLVRNVTQRLCEPLGARDEEDHELTVEPTAPPANRQPTEGVAVTMRGVDLCLGGHRILRDIDLDLPAGSHVAVVGPSGAGKSSLVGLLLGWHRPQRGTLLVDGEPLDGGRLAALRRSTAWVDPAVRLWNRALVDNLQYGSAAGASLDSVVDGAELRALIELLPEGLQASLGEGGGMVSGGEGQRVRFARALMRRDARLVILDEPFRGLDRTRRRALYSRARVRWPNATLVCITHDVGETRDFSRVIVIEDGRVVEDGAPETLAAASSRYRAMLAAETHVRQGLWRGTSFRRVELVDGKISDHGEGEQS